MPLYAAIATRVSALTPRPARNAASRDARSSSWCQVRLRSPCVTAVRSARTSATVSSTVAKFSLTLPPCRLPGPLRNRPCFTCPGWSGRRLRPQQFLRLLAQREVVLLFLGGMQPEGGVQPVEQGSKISDIVLVGLTGPDVVDELPKPPDLVGDLGVGPAHGGGGVATAEKSVHGRVELFLLGLLVRADLLHQEPVNL